MGSAPRPLMLVAVLVGLAAGAQESDPFIYTWTDADGTVHYTDDRTRVPKGVRPKVTPGAPLQVMPGPRTGARDGGEAPDAGLQRAVLTVASAEVPVPGPEVQWRTRFQGARELLVRLEAEVAQDSKVVAATSRFICAGGVTPGGPGCVVVGNPEHEAAQRRLDENAGRLKLARDDLRTLEKAAAEEGIPLDWRR